MQRIAPPPKRFNYEKYLEILNHGPMRNKASKKVIIVGAGMSGLTAGRLLKQMGHNIKIIEASDKVGGRIKTFRHPSGWVGELGAIQILDCHKLVLSLIRNYSLNIVPFQRTGSRNFLFMNGIRLRESIFSLKKNPFKLDFTKEESRYTVSELIQMYEEAILDDLEKLDWKKAMTYMDSFSVKEYLENCCNFSEAAIQQILFCMNFEGLSYVSMYELIRMMFSFNIEYPQVVKDGLDNLPRKISEDFANNTILFKAKVQRISDRKTYSCVHYSINKSTEIETECAEYVIVATSIAALKIINFKPKLDVKKQRAINNMNFESATRIVEKFKTPFWESEGIYQGDITTDWHTGSINIPGRQVERSLIYGGVGEGRTTHLLNGLSELDLIEYHLNKLSTLFRKKVKTVFDSGVVYKWLNDPFSLGGFSLCLPKQCSNDFNKNLKKSSGRIHFAGEHTSDSHAWVEGAVESGIRVALEIQKRTD
ncbi:DgyrCDS3457 [Dimorphilus gyrociliatus]|nr:DgyrCDS3457 [Dimorphilus gyrociliatus]